MMKHTEKVDALQKRLESFSKLLCTAGVIMTSFAVYCYMTKA